MNSDDAEPGVSAQAPMARLGASWESWGVGPFEDLDASPVDAQFRFLVKCNLGTSEPSPVDLCRW